MHRKTVTVVFCDAADAFEQALACYLRKRNLAMAAQVRRAWRPSARDEFARAVRSAPLKRPSPEVGEWAG